jgi:Ser/Thr protein kinase RdoA (MazF antagonist)
VPSGLVETDAELAKLCASEWLARPTLTPITAMNSSTWLVEAETRRYVLKVATPDQAPGLKAAAWLDSHGLKAGAPVRTAVRTDRLVALLDFVEGTPLSANEPADRASIGKTLARAHRLLTGCRVPRGMSKWRWSWVDPGIIGDDRLRAAATAAIGRAEKPAPGLTHGILHGDPAPEAFLRAGESIALIDWGAACYGPLLYDLASAVMYAGPDLITAYQETISLPSAELDAVGVFQAYRWAVQAWYFSSRLVSGDLTGLSDAAENEKGLADARNALLG